MSEPRHGECYICGIEQAIWYVGLYVVGSEGCWLCEACRNLVTEVARLLHSSRFRAQWSRKRAQGDD